MPDNINLIVNETIDNVIINPSTTNDIVDVSIYETVSAVDISITEVVENVSILVDETITSVNIVVDETIDLTTINVTDTPTNVEITVNPLTTVVNLNKVTSIGGTGNTNLSYSPSPSNGLVNSDTGYSATIPLTDSTNAGLFSPTEKTKLTNITGTNTGDETVSTIKSKLGITTLSGSNTGDETTATIKSKLGITTLSGSNTGDQNISLQSVLNAGDFATDKRIRLFSDTSSNDLIELELSADSTYGDNTSGLVVLPALVSQNSIYCNTYNGVGFFKVNSVADVYANKFIKNGGTGANILLDNGTTLASSSKENYLNNPSVNGFVLSSTIAGVRSWVAQSGGGGGGVTDLSYTPSSTNGTVVSSTGTPAVIPLANITNAGLLTPSEKTLIASIPNINTDAVDRVSVKLGEEIFKGQAVYISSANGTNIIVSKASNATEATSSKTLGLLETSGLLNDFSKVITSGLLIGVDTSSATIGDPVFLGTSGNLLFGLANKPSAPKHLVSIGIVSRVNVSVGEIIVRVANGFELEEIHNVAISSIADKQLLSYDSSTSLWKNKSVTTADITASTNKNYVTDAQASIIGNTSGTNTGDQTLSGLGGVASNTAIVAGTNTKITYDAKGLVTLGTTLIASDIPTIAQAQVTSLTTDLALKANNSAVVHNTGVETVAGLKTFSDGINAGQGSPYYNTIAYLDGTGKLGGLYLGVYPTLSELSFVKGVQAVGIQTQINTKNDLIVAHEVLGSTIKGHNLGVPLVSQITTVQAIVSNQNRLTAYYIPYDTTITGIRWYQSNQGVYTNTGTTYNGIGLYKWSANTLTLVASTTTDDTIWKGASGSFQSKVLSAPYSATKGIYYIGIMWTTLVTTSNPAIGTGSTYSPNGLTSGFMDFSSSGKLNPIVVGVTQLTSPLTPSGLNAVNYSNAVFLY